MKKISVVVPAYNATKYLRHTFYSVVCQTVAPCEIVVVDDCSTDATLDVVRSWKILFKFPLKIITHEENMGIGVSRQDGAIAAKGDYVCFLSSDDVLHPKFIESSIPYLDGTHGTFTDYWRCDELLKPTSPFVAPHFTNDGEFRILAINWALQKNMFVNFSSVIIPKSFFKKVEFVPDLRHGEDLIFLLDTLIAGFSWRHIPKFLLSYRIHSQQGTALRNIKEWLLLWKYLKIRLQSLEVPMRRINQAYDVNKMLMSTQTPPVKRVLRRLRFLVRSVGLKI